LAVCPAGEDVAARYLADRAGHVSDVVRPLQNKRETVYVAAASDAADHVARRFPHKRIRIVRASGRATNVRNFLGGMRLGFQRGKAGTLDATYHFVFTGRESAEATVTIRDGTLEVVPGRTGRADLTVTADARTWIRFVNREISLVRALVTGKIRLRGRPALLAAFGRCFPG
jgi:alkyl sulfatase BDS1-like metallo-beta-lactamase superfamily hydrolase